MSHKPPKILERIAAETGLARLDAVLANEVSPGDLQSLLLHVFQQRSGALREADLMQSAERSLLTPSRVDARVINRFDQVAFSTAGRFEALELSPVSALGLNRVLGEIDQNNVLTTIRNAEVLGDPTPALALECARRRRDPKLRVAGAVRLCASQRVIRLQPFDVPGFTPHFRLFALVSAGRDSGSHTFEIEHLREHVRFYLELCRALGHAGFSFERPRVEISDVSVIRDLLSAAGVALEELRAAIRAHKLGESARFLADRGVVLPEEVWDPVKELPGINAQHRLARVKAEIFDALAPSFPEAEFRFNLARLEGLSYYRGLCLRISPLAPDGNRYSVVDGGFTDWTARLLQDRKERMLASGIGTEFACSRYGAAES
jgi:hypothetical protein